jgi:transposase-like protein
MSKTTRRRFTAAFKAQVCLEALKERETIEVLAKRFNIHPSQINSWKREFISKSESIFDGSSDSGKEKQDNLIETLYSRIGELSVANDFLKKKLR